MNDVAGEGAATETLFGIGTFALMSGLSIPRLRRYHDIALLVPAHVDPVTGYRGYAANQLPLARQVARLRDVDLPIAEMRAALHGETGERLDLLRRHRDRLTTRIEDTHRLVGIVDQLISEERATMSIASPQLVEVTLRVEDVERTVAFYREAFGFEFQPDDHNGAVPVHYDACGGAWQPKGFFLFTIYPAGDYPPSRTSVGFGVPDVDVVWARAVAHGAKELTAPTDSGYMPRNAVFADPAGNRISIYEMSGDE